jgi:hypothetical protein
VRQFDDGVIATAR